MELFQPTATLVFKLESFLNHVDVAWLIERTVLPVVLGFVLVKIKSGDVVVGLFGYLWFELVVWFGLLFSQVCVCLLASKSIFLSLYFLFEFVSLFHDCLSLAFEDLNIVPELFDIIG